MTSGTISRLGFAAFAGLALSVITAPAGAVGLVQTERAEISLDYEAYFGGMHIVSARADIMLDADSYRVDSKARARGLLDWFSGWFGEAVSRGDIVDGKPRPVEHTNAGHWREKPRSLSMIYKPDGVIEVEETSPPDQNELTPIPEGATDNTIDPITAIIGMANVLADGGACDGFLAIYDGRRRYDVDMTDGGSHDLEPNEYNIFDGEARACKFEIERIGGFRIERSQFAREARDRTIWVAKPFEDAPPIPVRINAETAFGRLVVHLVAARIGDREIAVQPGRDVLAEE